MAIKHTVKADGKGNTKQVTVTALKAIRGHCIECMGFQIHEVARCTNHLCYLYPFKAGNNISLKGRRKNNLKLTHQKAV
jgi:hypothetical protein